jgi:hypothetical protein
MKLNYFIGLGLIPLLVSCGGDVSSNRKKGNNSSSPDRSTQAAEGSAGQDNIRSFIHREKGSTVISYTQEISKTLAKDLPMSLYRTIPSMEKDDEGSAKNVITTTNIGRPTTSCGIGENFAGIDARITDCYLKNREKALWEGQRYGAAGEGTWKLVGLSADGKETWFDGRTGMVWSDLHSKTNWCKASGNTENATTTETIDCNNFNDTISGEEVCIDAVTPGLGTQIKWRLPTRNDFLQADLNGLRFVLIKENADGLWTATMKARVPGRTDAWVYHSTDGSLSSANLATERQVRCIGVPVR